MAKRLPLLPEDKLHRISLLALCALLAGQGIVGLWNLRVRAHKDACRGAMWGTLSIATAEMQNRYGEADTLELTGILESDFAWLWPVDKTGVAVPATPWIRSTDTGDSRDHMIWTNGNDGTLSEAVSVRYLLSQRPEAITATHVGDALLGPFVVSGFRLGPNAMTPAQTLRAVGVRPIKESIAGLSARYGPILYYRTPGAMAIAVEFTFEGRRQRKSYIRNDALGAFVEGYGGAKNPQNWSTPRSTQEGPNAGIWFELDEDAFTEYVTPVVR